MQAGQSSEWKALMLLFTTDAFRSVVTAGGCLTSA
jgi:hypothetical protein